MFCIWYSISCFFKHIKRRKKGERRDDPDDPERKRNEVQDGALWAGWGREKDFWGIGAALAWVNLGRPKISSGGWRENWYRPVRAVRAPWPAGPDSPDFGRQPHAFHVSLNVSVKAKQQAILQRDWYQGRVRVTGRLKQGLVNWGRATFVIGKIEKILILLLLFAVYGKPEPTGTFIGPWVNRHLHLYHGKSQGCPVLHLGEWDPAVSVLILKHLGRWFKHLNSF